METDACGVCNGNNNLATFVSDSSSEVINFGTLKLYKTVMCVTGRFLCSGSKCNIAPEFSASSKVQYLKQNQFEGIE